MEQSLSSLMGVLFSVAWSKKALVPLTHSKQRARKFIFLHLLCVWYSMTYCEKIEKAKVKYSSALLY